MTGIPEEYSDYSSSDTAWTDEIYRGNTGYAYTVPGSISSQSSTTGSDASSYSTPPSRYSIISGSRSTPSSHSSSSRSQSNTSASSAYGYAHPAHPFFGYDSIASSDTASSFTPHRHRYNFGWDARAGTSIPTSSSTSSSGRQNLHAMLDDSDGWYDYQDIPAYTPVPVPAFERQRPRGHERERRTHMPDNGSDSTDASKLSDLLHQLLRPIGSYGKKSSSQRGYPSRSQGSARTPDEPRDARRQRGNGNRHYSPVERDTAKHYGRAEMPHAEQGPRYGCRGCGKTYASALQASDHPRICIPRMRAQRRSRPVRMPTFRGTAR